MATVKQIPVLAGKVVEYQEGFSVLSTADAQSAIMDMPAFIACACEAWTKSCRGANGYLRLISGAQAFTLDACEDSLISGATEIFDGWIDPDFENYGCNVTGSSTGPTNIQGYEMIKGGDYKTTYGAMSDNLEALCLTQGQIKEFVKKYRNWLRTDGCGTLFLFKANKQFFVAYVFFGSSRLNVRVGRLLSLDAVWDAGIRRRFVIPQLSA